MRASIGLPALWLSLCVLAIAVAPCGAAEAKRSLAIQPAEAGRRLNSGERIIIVDVREELERGLDGHIPGDISVPLSPKAQFAHAIQAAVPDRNVTVFTYCKRGIVNGLSNQAAEIMAGLGYTKVYYITGGFDGWPYQKSK